ncbi:MAG: hypothetical protein NT169_08720 [Chloroflexi bacterium]|nr:hypothetical protein [Chloroflexota bacterium]
MDERKFVADFPYGSDVVARELFRQIDETYDQSPYLFVLYGRSLNGHRLRQESLSGIEDWLTGEITSDGVPIVDECKMLAYVNNKRFETGDSYDFAAIRTFTIMAIRYADAHNPRKLEDPQAVKAEIMPRADGSTRLVLRCAAPPSAAEYDHLDDDEGRRYVAALCAHSAAAASYCALLRERMRDALGVTEAVKQPSETASVIIVGSGNVVGGGSSSRVLQGAPAAPTEAAVRPTGSARNTAARRDLLNAAFNDDELMTFCYDYFRPVYDDFASGMSKGQKIQRLLDFCERQEQVEHLLAVVRKANPKQYQRFAGQLTG